MKHLFLLAGLVLASSPSWGSGSSVHQVNLDGLSCGSARTLVANAGAVVFKFQNDKLALVVNGHQHCDARDRMVRFEQDVGGTRDCMLGYTCEELFSGQ